VSREERNCRRAGIKFRTGKESAISREAKTFFIPRLTATTVNKTGCPSIIYFLVSFATFWGAESPSLPLSMLANPSGASFERGPI
jgi:hypothetical protein